MIAGPQTGGGPPTPPLHKVPATNPTAAPSAPADGNSSVTGQKGAKEALLRHGGNSSQGLPALGRLTQEARLLSASQPTLPHRSWVGVQPHPPLHRKASGGNLLAAPFLAGQLARGGSAGMLTSNAPVLLATYIPFNAQIQAPATGPIQSILTQATPPNMGKYTQSSPHTAFVPAPTAAHMPSPASMPSPSPPKQTPLSLCHPFACTHPFVSHPHPLPTSSPETNPDAPLSFLLSPSLLHSSLSWTKTVVAVLDASSQTPPYTSPPLLLSFPLLYTSSILCLHPCFTTSTLWAQIITYLLSPSRLVSRLLSAASPEPQSPGIQHASFCFSVLWPAPTPIPSPIPTPTQNTRSRSSITSQTPTQTITPVTHTQTFTPTPSPTLATSVPSLSKGSLNTCLQTSVSSSVRCPTLSQIPKQAKTGQTPAPSSTPACTPSTKVTFSVHPVKQTPPVISSSPSSGSARTTTASTTSSSTSLRPQPSSTNPSSLTTTSPNVPPASSYTPKQIPTSSAATAYSSELNTPFTPAQTSRPSTTSPTQSANAATNANTPAPKGGKNDSQLELTIKDSEGLRHKLPPNV
ncbi:unnamed protein product [Pleuronectes platessa]|uniref:Uncharacterized protein n=1 Tax=Pleuronectes platessa TaxID=8262 RepID=A0A9N7YZS9_PLEPL|nr:unnamed protein product [Pleuronectes platessa]